MVSVQLLVALRLYSGSAAGVYPAGAIVQISSDLASALIAAGSAVAAPSGAGPTPPVVTQTVGVQVAGVLKQLQLGAGFAITSDGGTITASNNGSLSTAQNAALNAVTNILDGQGHVIAPVVGDASNALIGGITGTALKAEADASKAADTAQSGSISSLGTSVASATNQLNGLLAGAYESASISGNKITFANASGSALGTLTLPSVSGTIAAPASAPFLFTDANQVLHAGATVSAHVVSNGGTLDLSSAVLNGVISGYTQSGNTGTFTTVGGQAIVITAPTGAQGPAGTLSGGDASGVVVEASGAGPARTLGNVVAVGSVSPANFGAQRSQATVASVIGQVTRSGIASWKNAANQTPYAFVANQPFPDGSADYRIHVPPAFGTALVAIGGTQVNPTVDLHSHVTLTAAGYQGQDGHFYLPIPGLNPAIAVGQAVSGGVTASDNSTVALASGTSVTSLDPGNFRIGISAQGTHVGTDGNTYPNTTGARAVLTIGSLKVVCRNGSYRDGSGNWWIDMPNIGESFILDMTVQGGNIAAGSKVVLTQGNCLRITDQPGGTSVPAGTQLDFGADMSRVTQGLYVHTAEGTTALSSITAVNGSVITLSGPLTSGQSYGNTVPYNGIRSMVRMTFYKPLAADANLGNVLWMDTLASAAAIYACPYGGAVEFEPGDTCVQNLIITGGNAALRFKKGVVLHGGTGGVMITHYPQVGSDICFEHAHIFNGGLQDAAYEIDGTQYSWYVQNTSNGISVDINHNVFFGQYQDACRIQNVGNYHWDRNEVFGPGKTLTRGNGLRLSNAVLGTTEANNFHNCPIGVRQTGYSEDNQGGRNSFDQCGRGFDMENSSTFNGYCGLIFKWRDGDDDCINNTLYLKSCLEPIISDCEASASGGKEAYVLAGCFTGLLADIEGGCGGSSGACVHMTSAMLDGGYNGCGRIKSHDINVNGWTYALQLDAGSNSNPWHDHTCNGTATGAVLDNGVGNAPLGATGVPADYADAAADYLLAEIAKQNIGTGSATLVAHALSNCPCWNDGTQTYTTPYAGLYEVEVEPIFADTGTAAVTGGSTPYNAASPAGIRFFVNFMGNGGVLKAVFITTQPISTSQPTKWAFYAPANTSLGVQMQGDAAGLVNDGLFTIRCKQRTF